MAKIKINPEEELKIKYIPVTEATLWDKNPKDHDFQMLVESIEQYGFQDAGKFESSLNNGEGGVVFGNGRTWAVKYMMEHDFEVPKGIGTDDDGMWYLPVIFGNDIADEGKAEAFALDHNLIGVVGINGITHLDAVRMYNQDRFLDIASNLSMVATDYDDLELMRMLMDRQLEEPELEDIEDSTPLEKKEKLPSLSIKFSGEIEKTDFQELLATIWKSDHEYDEKGDLLVEVLNLYVTEMGLDV